MPTSIEPAAADSRSVSGRNARRIGENGLVPGEADKLAAPPIRRSDTLIPDTTSDFANLTGAIRQAADRVAEWVPKGVHFGWEKSFRNKGKFPATMSKEEARSLVAGLLRGAPLRIDREDPLSAPGIERFRVVADAGRIIGTRGQRRVRMIVVRDGIDFAVENAFPVRER